MNTERGRAAWPGQFRLTRLQLVNWGTFGGYKDIPVDERGVLFTGPSGSGKSCLLDGHSMALLPTHDQRFNASADLTAEGSKQATRNIADYVRGAWSATNDEHDHARVRYLRGGNATWSAIAVTYDDRRGAVVTGVVVRWFTGTENDGGELRKMHQIHDGHFDLSAMEEWARRGFDLTWFKNTYPGTYRGKQGEYLRELHGRVGLGNSRVAQSLLGKAKAMKNVGDLNKFIRSNMLDRPATFDTAEQMLETFTPLNEAHTTASRAHQQAKDLRGLPQHWHVYRTSAETGSRMAILLGDPVQRYLRGKHLELLQRELDTINATVESLDGLLGSQEDALEMAKEHYLSLERQLREKSGVLTELEAQRSAALSDAAKRHDAYRHYSAHVGRLQQPCPQDEASFTDLAGRLAELQRQAEHSRDEIKTQRYAAFSSATEACRKHDSASNELESLRAATSLIPREQSRRRELIADATGVPSAELPYAAELIDVPSGQERWRPAAERVLRGYGLRLLVGRQHSDAVRAHIDTNDMRGVVEYSVVDDSPERAGDADPTTLAGKLSVDTDHPHGPWLRAQLNRHFDHTCVDTAEELDRHRSAVTVHGTVKSPGNRYRKDDRHALTNRSSYILGVHTANKRAALEAEVEELAEAARQANAAADELNQRYETFQKAAEAAEQLRSYTSWAELNHWEPARTARELGERIERLKAEDVDLQQLQRDRDDAEERYDSAARARADTAGQITKATSQQTQLTDTHAAESGKPHTVDEADRAELDDVFAQLEITVAADRIGDVGTALRKDLEQRRKTASREHDTAREAVQRIINGFIEAWPDAAPDTSGEIDRCGDDFVALLHEIEQRRLPEAMQRFQHLISEGMVPSVSILQQEIDSADREIKKRIEMVNQGLRRVEFNPGTHLQIAFRSNKPQDALEFRNRVDEILREAGQGRRGDPEVALAQFRRIQRLMASFSGTDPEARQWQQNVLDVRTGYTFYGREVDGAGETAHTYHNTASNSGGEQEKLGAFCLAAALSYNLAGPDTDGRPRFAPLMLDEAFSKSDESYSYQALAAFEEFGFQLLIAAPIRMAGIVEPVIGQAVLVDKRTTTAGAQSNCRSATFGELEVTGTAQEDVRAYA